jgi:hypothetical protein
MTNISADKFAIISGSFQLIQNIWKLKPEELSKFSLMLLILSVHNIALVSGLMTKDIARFCEWVGETEF